MANSIYGAYGVRGIWGETLTVPVIRDIIAAYASAVQPTTVLCGRDARTSGPEIQTAVMDTLQAWGVNVIDIGVVSIDALDYATEFLGVDGGVHVTASHNPPQWNGLKLRRAHAKTLVGEEIKGLEKVVAAGLSVPVGTQPGSRTVKDISGDYVNMVKSKFRGQRQLKVVVDPGNGATSELVAKVLDSIGVTWSGIHMTMNGLFPDRGPDPKLPGALDALAKKVVEEKADVGVAFDADGDRMFLIDEQGKALLGETTGILIAREILKQQPGATFVYNVVCSRATPELITAAGGKAVRVGVGSVRILPAIRALGAVMGIETSGHYIQRDLNCLDSGIVPMVLALNAIAGQDKPLSKLSAGLDPYFHEFLDLKHDDVQGALKRVRSAFANAQQDELDGLTVSYPTWWCNARPSNTEPLLRLTIEAKTADELARRRVEILKIVQS